MQTGDEGDDAIYSLRRTLIAAAREFNRGHYFEAHEIIEDGLEGAPDELWDLLLGLIQIAVGYHKATQVGAIGAAKMLRLGLEKIQRYPPDAAQLNLEGLRRQVVSNLDRLAQGTFAATIVNDPPRLQLAKAERGKAKD